jgi:hypothetical protein
VLLLVLLLVLVMGLVHPQLVLPLVVLLHRLNHLLMVVLELVDLALQTEYLMAVINLQMVVVLEYLLEYIPLVFLENN